MEQIKLNPLDVQKALVTQYATSESQLRQSLKGFDSEVRARDAASPSPQQIPNEPAFATSFGDTIQTSASTGALDPGPPQPIPASSQPASWVTVTGVLNGVAAAGIAAFIDQPVPL